MSAAVPTPRDHVTTGDGARLAVRVGGPEDGPPLLLLPGQANSSRWWDQLRGGFEDEFRTVTFDYRGTGDTVAEVERWSTASFAADALAVMTALGHGRFGVYGTSMGGRVAQHLAASRPDLVDRLVLACTSPGGPYAREREPQVRRALAAPRTERLAAAARFFYTDAWLADHGPDDSLLLGDLTMTRPAALAHLRVSDRHDAWDLLGSITAPTLVLHGTDDVMVPHENAPLIAERIPHSRIELYAGGRHGFFDEFAEVVTPMVREFLRGGRGRVGSSAW